MKRTSTLVFFIGLAFLDIGCSRSPTSAVASGDLMPLKVGNMWIYQRVNYSETSAETTTSFDTITIVSSHINGGTTYYVSNFGAEYYYDSRGLWVALFGIPRFIAKYPIGASEVMPTDSFAVVPESSPDPYDLAIGTQKLVGQNQTLRFSNGDVFTCQQFQRDYMGTVHDSLYFSELMSFQLGTGMVWQEYLRPNGHGGQYRQESNQLIKSVIN